MRRAMTLVLALSLLLALAAAGPAAAAEPARASAAAKKKKCKAGYVRKSVKVRKNGRTRRVRKCVRRPAARKQAPAAPAPGTGTVPAAPQDSPAAPPQLQRTRDDAAGQAALGQGLLLERASFGSVTAEYMRIFLRPDGTVRMSIIDWNEVSGERCRQTIDGTWAFKEGGRLTAPDGRSGTYAIITTTANGQTGDELFVFPDGSQTVYFGKDLVAFERNPNMRDQC